MMWAASLQDNLSNCTCLICTSENFQMSSIGFKHSDNFFNLSRNHNSQTFLSGYSSVIYSHLELRVATHRGKHSQLLDKVAHPWAVSVNWKPCSLFLQYFYSIKDISVGGICMCNGHADACVQSSREGNSQFVCQCKHMTCGTKCERCCSGFVQKPWKPATPDNNNECERK